MRCGRSMNRQDRDTETGMRLTERTVLVMSKYSLPEQVGGRKPLLDEQRPLKQMMLVNAERSPLLWQQVNRLSSWFLLSTRISAGLAAAAPVISSLAAMHTAGPSRFAYICSTHLYTSSCNRTLQITAVICRLPAPTALLSRNRRHRLFAEKTDMITS